MNTFEDILFDVTDDIANSCEGKPSEQEIDTYMDDLKQKVKAAFGWA